MTLAENDTGGDIGEAAGPASRLEHVPADFLQPINIGELFAKESPLELDLGCGDGSFLVAMAKAHPERNYIGVERLYGRVRNSGRKAERAGLENVRLLRVESAYVVRHLLPPGSAARMYVLFPDPWPKRRHWARRLVQPEFLDAVATALAAGGDICIKTDDAEYFTWIEKVARECDRFSIQAWGEEMPRTDFERHYVAQGRRIQSLRLVKRW